MHFNCLFNLTIKKKGYLIKFLIVIFQVIEIDVANLPEANDLIDVLKQENAPLNTWFSVAVSSNGYLIALLTWLLIKTNLIISPDFFLSWNTIDKAAMKNT